MRKLKIGVVGLGSIAQKAYLPILTKEDNWELIGAFSPNQSKARLVCDRYRIELFSRLDSLAQQCDAVFVHSATASHYEVIKRLLDLNVHVYVDKPLTEQIEQSEQLIELADLRQKGLMVGFNRRFSPFYMALKYDLQNISSLRMEKHRTNSVGPKDVRFTLLDDYLHVVDTVIWMAGDDSEAKLISGNIQATSQGELFYAEHHIQAGLCWLTTSMHRKAGSQQEKLIAVAEDSIHQITNMNHWRSEDGTGIHEANPGSWDSTLLQRGFDGAIRHFIDSVSNQSQPLISGEQAIMAQRLVEKMILESKQMANT
ncbi:Gfo/Idh/MocA family oxidoreductase [Providencia sp.]|uniref:Gfo/Idh/MocA family protein n=1 Tax=Providencia sp. TaxID=589 RepID=UPI001DA8F108|nr:Gfo/Idh/MocA family oxidoreductase [Providencia rettgeri]EIU9515312.1 Gfo/Idh/MocA family oxidoreductase [Providencia rettgeri]ELR5094762.1 Gfo/Idh/MocA family oxidoreductase [Providencia rettgeri]